MQTTMSHTTQTPALDLSYLAVLLLLAYVMSSAPKYIRNFREEHNDIKIEKMAPIKQVLKLGKYYAIDPYLRAWNKLAPVKSRFIPQKPSPNLTAVSSSVLR